MTFIIKQSYRKVVREINSIEQKRTTETRYLTLYDDKITTKFREFPIQDVLDISFKKIQNNEGMLFLHTNHGVYSYHVPTNPVEFIEECKTSIKRNQI